MDWRNDEKKNMISSEEKDMAAALTNGEEGNAMTNKEDAAVVGEEDKVRDAAVADGTEDTEDGCAKMPDESTNNPNNECNSETRVPSAEVHDQEKGDTKKPAAGDSPVAESKVKKAVMSVMSMKKSNTENKDQSAVADSKDKTNLLADDVIETIETLANGAEEQIEVADARRLPRVEEVEEVADLPNVPNVPNVPRGEMSVSDSVGKKRNKLGLTLSKLSKSKANLSAFSKALSIPNLSKKKSQLPNVCNLGAKNQDTPDANTIKSTEEVDVAVAADKETEGKNTPAVMALDGIIADVITNDHLAIGTSVSTFSIITNDTAVTEYITADASDGNNDVTVDSKKKSRDEEKVLQMEKKTQEYRLKEEVTMKEVTIEDLHAWPEDNRRKARHEEVKRQYDPLPEEVSLEEVHTEEILARTEELVLLVVSSNEEQSCAGCDIMSIFGWSGNDQKGDTISIKSDEARFVLNHVSEDKELVWNHSLIEEMKDVDESLNVSEVKKLASNKKMANIKQHLLGYQRLPPSAPEEVKAGYYQALSRAAVLSAKMESRRAELELRKIELESIQLEQQIDCIERGAGSGIDDVSFIESFLSLATYESEEGFLSGLTSWFKPQQAEKKKNWNKTRSIAASRTGPWGGIPPSVSTLSMSSTVATKATK